MCHLQTLIKLLIYLTFNLLVPIRTPVISHICWNNSNRHYLRKSGWEQREVRSVLPLKRILLYSNNSESQKNNGNANCSAGTENMPEKMNLFSSSPRYRTHFRGSMLRVNPIRVIICDEIIFFSDLELRRCYFLTIRYLKTKAL